MSNKDSLAKLRDAATANVTFQSTSFMFAVVLRRAGFLVLKNPSDERTVRGPKGDLFTIEQAVTTVLCANVERFMRDPDLEKAAQRIEAKNG